MSCPSELDLARAHGDDADPALRAHVRGCATCAEAWAATDALLALARALPAPAPPPRARAEQVRTALLAAATPAATPRRGRWVIAGAVVATAAAAGAVLALRRPPRQAALLPHHGQVAARGAARFDRTWLAPDEVVRLRDGTVDVAVTPLAPGERFRVVVGAAEVEVRGTAFAVTARDGVLVGVQVEHGRVEVRPADGALVVLGAGEVWRAPAAPTRVAPTPVAPTAPAPTAPTPTAPTAPTPVAPTPTGPAPRLWARTPRASSPVPPTPSAPTPVAPTPVAPTPVAPTPAPATAPTPPARSAETAAYDDGWAALRGGRFHDAAAALARSIALAPDGPLADDARYWRAVALARDHRRRDAIGAFRELLDERRAADRRAEASVMLGWLLVDDGQRDEAARRFRVAIDDPRAELAASARAGLAATGR